MIQCFTNPPHPTPQGSRKEKQTKYKTQNKQTVKVGTQNIVTNVSCISLDNAQNGNIL